MTTENMEMREREISLLDLLVEILLHWRTLLAAMLLGGIVLGGARSLQNVKIAEAQQHALEQQQGMSQEERTEQWEAQGISMRGQLDDEQLARVYTALVLRQRYEEGLDYQQHSFLMQMDPLHIQRVELTFAVRASDTERAYNITEVYEHLLAGVALHEYVESRCGIEDSVSEIITLRKPENSMAQNGIFIREEQTNVVNVQVLNAEKTNVVSVQILYGDTDICNAMADAVVDFTQQQQKELEQTLGDHEIILLSRSLGEVTDSSVATLQNNCATTLYSLSRNYSNLMKLITGKELEYYNYLLAGGPADNRNAEPQSGEDGQGKYASGAALPQPGVSVKYVFLGIVLFAFIYVVMLGVKYIMNNKLRSTDSFNELYGIPQLGTVCVLSPKRFLGVVDQWILKLRYHNQRRFTPEESVGLAAVAVKMAALKKGAGTVCCLGCELKGNTLDICGRMKEQLKAAGIEVNILSNVLYDAEAMERLSGVGSVVLVETAGVTLYDEIVKELELLRRQEIAVLGGIVVE